MSNNFMGVLRVEAEISRLEITLAVTHAYALTDDDKEVLRRLILHEPDCNAHRLYQAISMLIPSPASSDEISSAIAKVCWIFDGEIFRSNLWWQGIVAFRQYDSIQSNFRLLN